MPDFLPWLRITAAIIVYVIFALLALIVTSKMDIDLKKMESRTSVPILFIGAFANLCILGIILLLLTFWDGHPLGSLGLSFLTKDFLYSAIGIGLIFFAAVIFIYLVQASGRATLTFEKPAKDQSDMIGLIGGIVTLFIVALQEEVLYRGYITLNLLQYSPAIIIIVTTILFTVIHLITNRGGFYQILSWLMGGALFSYIYLITGSIWVPILLHFATDLNNMLIFNIAGRFSFFRISPAITKRQLAFYKIVTSLMLVAILLALYGPSFNLM
ncbi:MAG: type II CAAX endopeptidase family protein [Balneolaceae bacterium]|jgi:membrane protease YdiL (CAAX protease family)